MAWIELHQELPNHPKTLRLARLAGLKDPDAAWAKLARLWLWALSYCIDGKLEVASRPLTDKEIADASNFRGNENVWTDALIESGWVDPIDGGDGIKTLQLHDWQRYAGRLIERRENARERVAKHRNAQRNANVTQPATRTFASTVPNRTVPNQEREDGDVSLSDSHIAKELPGSSPEAILVEHWRNQPDRSPINLQAGVKQLRIAVAAGVSLQDIQTAFWDSKLCAGKAIWDVLTPLKEKLKQKPKPIGDPGYRLDPVPDWQKEKEETS